MEVKYLSNDQSWKDMLWNKTILSRWEKVGVDIGTFYVPLSLDLFLFYNAVSMSTIVNRIALMQKKPLYDIQLVVWDKPNEYITTQCISDSLELVEYGDSLYLLGKMTTDVKDYMFSNQYLSIFGRSIFYYGTMSGYRYD